MLVEILIVYLICVLIVFMNNVGCQILKQDVEMIHIS